MLALGKLWQCLELCHPALILVFRSQPMLACNSVMGWLGELRIHHEEAQLWTGLVVCALDAPQAAPTHDAIHKVQALCMMVSPGVTLP